MLHLLHSVDVVLNLTWEEMMLSPAGRFVQVSARKPQDELCDWFGPSLLLCSLERTYPSPVGTHSLYSYYTDITSSIPWPECQEEEYWDLATNMKNSMGLDKPYPTCYYFLRSSIELIS